MANQTPPRIQFRTDDEIRVVAEKIRAQHDLQGQVPIDILLVAESNLDLTIIPKRGLSTAGDIDAVLLSNLSEIIVDELMFMQDRFYFRLRFSIAHEIGHIVLHGDYIRANGPRSVEEVYEHIKDHSPLNYGSGEHQANEFAGRLLVPVHILREEVDRNAAKIHALKDAADRAGMVVSGDQLAGYIANGIGQRFEVSDKVIEKRLISERILEEYM